jgi:hypothetical protein
MRRNENPYAPNFRTHLEPAPCMRNRLIILGFTGLGVGVGEVLSSVQIAMLGGLPYTALRDAILTHPTLARRRLRPARASGSLIALGVEQRGSAASLMAGPRI